MVSDQSKKYSIVIGHPLTLIREGISKIMEEAGFKILGHAGNLASLYKLTMELSPDITLLDVGLNGYNLNSIKKLADNSIVVVLTPPHDPKIAAMAIKAGAKGFISANQSSVEFVQMLNVITTGNVVISKETLEYYNKNFSNEVEQLTKRENEVLLLLGRGMTNREIAKALYISEPTAKNHVTNILHKLDLKNRQQATVFASNL